LDPNDVTNVANRSAAYRRAGPNYYNKAVADAERCVSLEPSNSVGYLRLADVLLAQQKYQDAIKVLREGLSKSNTDPMGGLNADEKTKGALEHALLGVQRAMVLQYPASKVAVKMTAAHNASQWRKTEAAHAPTPAMKTIHQQKCQRLAAAARANQKLLLEKIEAPMDNSRDLWDTLFHFVLDFNGHGEIYCKDLKQLLPSQKDTLDNILMQTGSGKDNDSLDADEFANIMQQFTGPPQKLAASMVQASMAAEGTPAPQRFSNTTELRKASLFSILDQDGSDTVSFYEMACGIYAWANVNLQDSSLLPNTRLLLLTEPNDTRRLDYHQFGKLMLSLSSTWNESLDDVIDDLVVAFADPDSNDNGKIISDELLQEITATVGDGPDGIDALTYARTRQLFSFFDVDGDGSIDFSELLKGLRKFQQASTHAGTPQSLDGSFKGTANMEAERIALKIFSHDDDYNQTLDPDEFAVGLVEFAQEAETDIHQLIDFMSVMVQKQDDDAYEKAYSEASMVSALKHKNSLRHRHNTSLHNSSVLMSYVEEEEEADDE